MKASQMDIREAQGIGVPAAVTKREEQVSAQRMVSFANILVATDFSPVSDRALEYALSLARRYDSRIFLAHIITPEAYQLLAPEIAVDTRASLRNAAERNMGDILISGRLRGVPHEVVVEEGALWPTIEILSNRLGIELIVAGTQGLGGMKKLLLGSGAEQIFRHTRLPVLTVGRATKGDTPNEVEFKNILFATDFGPGAEREATYALSLAQEHAAKLTMLHVVTHAKDYSEEGISLRMEAIRHELQELVPAGSEAWCDLAYRTKIGDPVEEILEAARETSADLIVMGAKKWRGLTGLAPNSKAYRIVCAAPCPVLTIRS